jgi:putative FmdB family regulatory protein
VTVVIISSRGPLREVDLPLYEYQCRKCGQRVEKIQKFSDPPLARCEHCGGKLERLLSSPAIQFKGAGWYVTDYARKSSSRPTEKAEKATDGAGGSASASEAKKATEPSTTKTK